ncbi:DNA polymerase III subunit delta' [Zoogloea sp.]|uniref:DNA polymerase III subunit delta' n=1 Tax=Zoogloea sp. TaxID=49181 RepID=UPI00261736FD|nr:DNA polymerase III subunit delta' [Zoogloea sp.]MDD3353987.1 DNA polymerase III subunit delta' [Zoogloea sp.]
MIHEWQAAVWQKVLDSAGRMPHALLLAGPAGGGKRDFAEALAARVLCATPGPQGHACGLCEDCLWRLSGNHPDLLRVLPEADQDALVEGEGSKAEKSDKPEKAASRQILIEQIRVLQQTLTTGGHRGGQRVVIVDPADAMNLFTANALLKLLEEPTTNALFLLVSATPKRLLPTIRSRCQSWPFPRPPAHMAARWLAGRGAGEAEALLAFSSGMPLAAATLAESGGASLRLRFANDLAGLPAKSPLKLAAEWDSWLKNKDAQAAGLDMPTLVSWMQRWIADLVSLRLQGPVRFFPDRRDVLQGLSAGLTVDAALGCYNEITQSRRVAQHPLNPRLFLEDMLLRYARSLQAAASSARP